tara:strand:+ start:2965 stop:4872 length:1908 start_codon:yes stop_codon:yes gene_type:complete
MDITPKYREALDGLKNPDWKLLVEFNKILLSYSVGEWKQEELMNMMEELDIAKKETGRGKKYTVAVLKSLINEKGLSKWNREQLIRIYAKQQISEKSKGKLISLLVDIELDADASEDSLRKELGSLSMVALTKRARAAGIEQDALDDLLDEKQTFDRSGIVDFLDRYKDRLKVVIQDISPGSQGLLHMKDIISDQRLNFVETSRELLYYSNPLFVLFTMVNEQNHRINDQVGYRRSEDTLSSETIRNPDLNREVWYEYVPYELENMIRMSRTTWESIRDNSLEIAKIVLAKLYDVDFLHDRSNINPIVNIILHSNLIERDQRAPIYERVKREYSFDLFQLLVENGLLKTKVKLDGVRYDVIFSSRSFPEAPEGKNLLQELPFASIVRDSLHIIRGENVGTTYYALCSPLLRRTWEEKRGLHESQKRLQFALGSQDPNSSFSNLDEIGLIRRIGENALAVNQPARRRTSETMRRQNIVGDVDRDYFLTERRLSLGNAITRDKSMLQEVPMEVIGKVVSFLSQEHFPMPEDKMKTILEDIHERREFEKSFGPVNEDQPRLMDREKPLFQMRAEAAPFHPGEGYKSEEGMTVEDYSDNDFVEDYSDNDFVEESDMEKKLRKPTVGGRRTVRTKRKARR